jgi:hypothetical protein
MPKKLLIPPYSRKHLNPPYPEHVTEELRERMREGPVTLSKPELQQIIAMMEIYSMRCGEAYQVVGQTADYAGVHEDPAIVKAMDLLARPLLRGEILPFFPDWLRKGPPPKRRRRKPRHLQMSWRGEEPGAGSGRAAGKKRKKKG